MLIETETDLICRGISEMMSCRTFVIVVVSWAD